MQRFLSVFASLNLDGLSDRFEQLLENTHMLMRIFYTLHRVYLHRIESRGVQTWRFPLREACATLRLRHLSQALDTDLRLGAQSWTAVGEKRAGASPAGSDAVVISMYIFEYFSGHTH